LRIFMNLDIKFDCSKFLGGVRKTICPADESFYHANQEKNPTWFSPLPEYIDRYNKIDAHSVFAVSLFFSSKHSLEEGNRVLASIGQYYSMFHLGYALVCLNFSLKDSTLKRMSHSKLKNLLINLEDRGIISIDFLKLYLDLQEVREYFNYLNAENGKNKFMILRRGHLTHSNCFGDVHLSDISAQAEEPISIIIDRFYSMLHEIELQITSKRKTNGHRPEIFRSIRRLSQYDWFGDDMMMNFYSDEVMRGIEHFLGCHDVIPDHEYYGI